MKPSVDRMASQLAGTLQTMTDEEGEPWPGTVLARAMALSEADASVLLEEYTCNLFNVAPPTAHRVLALLGAKIGFIGDVLGSDAEPDADS